MHIVLVVLGLALALLYFWLIGHWFARVVMFLLLAVAFGCGVAAALANPVGLLLGAALAWPASGIPVYWHRRGAGQSMELYLR